MYDVAPASEQVQPDVPMLGEAVELAEILKPSWPTLRQQNTGLTNEGEEEGTTETAPPEATDTETETDESGQFPDFDLSNVPDELRSDAERYAQEVKKHFQGDYTRKTQSLAEQVREAEQLRQQFDAMKNPQVLPALLAQYGYDAKTVLDMYGYQPEEEPEDEPDLYDRLARVEGQLTQREQAEQQARQEEAIMDHISGEIEKLEQKEGREFDAEEHKLLDAYARAYAQPSPDGRMIPNVEGAYQLLSGIYKSRQNQWIESKKTSRPPGAGKAASRTVDLSKESDEEFVQRMAGAVDRARASAQ